MSDEEKSEGQKRKEARAAAHKLKNDPFWTQKESVDPMEKLMNLDQELRTEEAFGAAEICEDCEKLRKFSEDETALCESHFAKAMGF